MDDSPPRETALANVELPLVYRGLSAKERKKKATEALAKAAAVASGLPQYSRKSVAPRMTTVPTSPASQAVSSGRTTDRATPSSLP